MAFVLSTAELAQALRTSDSTLRRLRREGVLEAGKHFRAVGSGTQRPQLLWCVDAVDQTLAQRSRRLFR